MARQAWFPLWRSIGAATRCSSVEFLAGAGLGRALTRGRLSTDLIGIPGKLRNGELKTDFERQSSHRSPLFCQCHHDRTLPFGKGSRVQADSLDLEGASGSKIREFVSAVKTTEDLLMQRTHIITLLCVLCLALPAPSLSHAGQGPGGREGGSRSVGASRRDARPMGGSISGQVISDGNRRIEHPIAVNMMTRGVVTDTVYTDGNGNFVFDQPRGAPVFEVSINEPGFKPGIVEVMTGSFAMGVTVIVLEAEDSDEDSPGNPNAIDLSELLAVIPDEAVELFEQAEEESEQDDHEKAAERLEEAIEIAPEYYQAQNTLGVEYERLGRTDDAIRHFLIAKDLSPNSAAPLVSLGAIYLRDNDVQNAAGQLEEGRASLDHAFNYLVDAVERDPLSEFAQYYLGAAHYRAGALDDALERLNRALGLNRQFHDVRIMLYNVYLGQRDYEAALDQLSTYLESYPDSPQREAIEQAKAQLEGQVSGP